MRVQVDAREVSVYVKGLKAMPSRVRTKLWTALQVTSVELERHVKATMPVDTGRARASWGRWSDSDSLKPIPKASAEDAIWQEDKPGLAITQGSNVPYIAALNAGHSKQAPAGFIDLGVEKAKRQLKSYADGITREVRP